jgi:L-ascorbate metabolism protein UlaG (beta-lactamase superfamily)
MNMGGTTQAPWGAIKMLPALHTSQLPDGDPGGCAAGFLLTIEQKHAYFACDTALFSDMKLYAAGAEVAVLPIGDFYTMGIDDSIHAIHLVEPKNVLPAHYNTFPAIEQDVDKWRFRVSQETRSNPVVLKVGESFEF